MVASSNEVSGGSSIACFPPIRNIAGAAKVCGGRDFRSIGVEFESSYSYIAKILILNAKLSGWDSWMLFELCA
jgi:hypothetical protein